MGHKQGMKSKGGSLLLGGGDLTNIQHYGSVIITLICNVIVTLGGEMREH